MAMCRCCPGCVQVRAREAAYDAKERAQGGILQASACSSRTALCWTELLGLAIKLPLPFELDEPCACGA